MCKWEYLVKEPEMVPFKTDVIACGVNEEWKVAALLTKNGSLFEANLETGGVLYTGLRFEGLINPSIVVSEDSIVLISEKRVIDIARYSWGIRADLCAQLPVVNWRVDCDGRIVARHKDIVYGLVVQQGIIRATKIDINDECSSEERVYKMGILSKFASTNMTMRVGSFEAQFKVPRGYNHLWDFPRWGRACEFILAVWGPGRPMMVADL